MFESFGSNRLLIRLKRNLKQSFSLSKIGKGCCLFYLFSK